MGSEKDLNEMLKGFRRKDNSKCLKKPRPIQTQKTPCSSWSDVKKGCQLKSIKQYIPVESVNANILRAQTELALINAVENMLRSNPIVLDPTGVGIKLDIPDRDPRNSQHSRNEPRTLRFRAMHLCGGHNYKFDSWRAKHAGCIIDTIKEPAIIAKGSSKRFYLRRYKDKTLHIVIVSEEKGSASVIGLAYQKSSDLVTQYPNIPAMQGDKTEKAQVIYKNQNL